jgi:glycosyltransferase involved in cell wall biosynthesis
MGQCRRSGGGLAYRHSDEFFAAADWLAHDDDLCTRLGRSGREFVRRFYHWPRIIENYLEFLRFD